MVSKSIISFFLLICVNADVKDFAMPVYSSALSRVLISYSSNMMKASPTINFIQVCESENWINQHSIMNEVLYTASREEGVFRVILDVEVLAKFAKKLKNRKRFNTIVLVDSFESFLKFFNCIELDTWDYSGNIVVAITIHSEDIYEAMMKMFEAFWSKHIVNVVVMFSPHANNYEVLLYTYYPFSAFYCERAVPVQLNQYIGNKFKNEIVYFPKKLHNFYGCPVSVVTFKSPPFMMYEQSSNGLVYIDGIDGTVLRVLAQQLNFNVTINIDQEGWGNIYENGTITGAMGALNRNEVNMTIGFFASLPRRVKIFKPSYVYYRTNLIWMVPPGKPQTPLHKLLNPLEKAIWIMISITIALGIFVIAIIKMKNVQLQKFIFGTKTKSPGMNLINIILGNSLHVLPFRNFARFLFLIFTFYCFILRSSYQGGLVKFMQLDTRYPQMMNTKELLDHNFSFYYLRSASAYMTEIPEIANIGQMISLDDFNKGLANTFDPHFKGAYLSSESHLAYRNKMASPKYIHWAPESIFSVNLVIYMQRDSCLGNVIDPILVNLFCSGLISKWASKWIDSKYMKEPPQESLQILSLEQLEGAFNLLGYGLTLASVAFCIEIICGAITQIYKFLKKISH